MPVQDVVQQMKPGGALAPLGEQFAAAVAEAPGSGQYKKAMDKALDSYTRQYGRAQEEILNPDLNDNLHYDGLEERLRGTHENMEQAAAGLPGFTDRQAMNTAVMPPQTKMLLPNAAPATGRRAVPRP